MAENLIEVALQEAPSVTLGTIHKKLTNLAPVGVSCLKNCFVEARKDATQALFTQTKDGEVTVSLEGYVIVPAEYLIYPRDLARIMPEIQAFYASVLKQK